MSPRDIRAELRSARVEAPPELRARVRLIAVQAPPPRRLTRRRLTLVLVPVAAAAAVAAAVVLSTRPGPQVDHGAIRSEGAVAPKATLAAPAPSATRAQRYEATLRLRVRAVPAAVSAAQRIAASLGGFPVSVHVATGPKSGTAQLVLRVPRAHVQAAVTRLSRLGTVVGEQLDIHDLQAGVNTTDRTIARLQKQLKALLAQPQTDAVKRQAAALTQRIVGLQRARAETLRRAHFATVRLSLATTPAAAKHARHVDVWPWLGCAAAMLVLVLAWRVVRRLREDALLSRS